MILKRFHFWKAWSKKTQQSSKAVKCFSIFIYLETEELHFQKKRAYQQASPRLLKHNIHLAYPILQVLLSKGMPWHKRNIDAFLSRALATPFSWCNREHPEAGQQCTWLESLGNVRFGLLSSKPGQAGAGFVPSLSFGAIPSKIQSGVIHGMGMTWAPSWIKNVLTALGNHPELFMFSCSWTEWCRMCENCHPVKLSGCLFWQDRLNREKKKKKGNSSQILISNWRFTV